MTFWLPDSATVKHSLKRHEHAFLKKCHLRNLKLNQDKVKRHPSSMKFMGHLFVSQGLRPDAENIHTMLQMPEPKDVTALKWFLGMVTYLAKFMPHLSNVPLRCLEDKNVEFQWLPQHALTTNTIKKYPMLFVIMMKASQSLSNAMQASLA